MNKYVTVPAHLAFKVALDLEARLHVMENKALRLANLVIEVAYEEEASGVPTGTAYEALAEVFDIFDNVDPRTKEMQEILDQCRLARQEFREGGYFAPDDLDVKEFDLPDTKN